MLSCKFSRIPWNDNIIYGKSEKLFCLHVIIRWKMYWLNWYSQCKKTEVYKVTYSSYTIILIIFYDCALYLYYAYSQTTASRHMCLFQCKTESTSRQILRTTPSCANCMMVQTRKNIYIECMYINLTILSTRCMFIEQHNTILFIKY